MQVKVIDYSLIQSDDQTELVEAAAKACREDNWYPCGGICVWFQPVTTEEHAFGAHAKTHYAQALVKYGPV